MKRFSFSSVFILIWFLWGSSFSQAASLTLFGNPLNYDPSWNWKTISTTHFQLIFPNTLSPIAPKVATYLEQAHTLLSKRLFWTPRHPTQVVLVDHTDLANGLTSAALRIGIVLYLTPPSDFSSIAYYDTWLKSLILHEYTHLLNGDPTEGWSEALRWIFGDTIRPNMLWSRWMSEGLAVYFETALTKGGRLRSPLYHNLLRSFFRAKLFKKGTIQIHHIEGPTPYFPGGEIPYLFGASIMKQLVEEGKHLAQQSADQRNRFSDPEQLLGILSKRSASRVPFFIQGNLQNVLGMNWYTLWYRWMHQARNRYQAQLRFLKKTPESSMRWITKNCLSCLFPALSPDGNWLAFYQKDLDHLEGLFLKNLRTGVTKRLTDQIDGSRLAFTKSGRFLLFSTPRRQKNYYLYQELFAYDLKKDEEIQLTFYSRSQDLNFLAPKNLITFIRFEKNVFSLYEAKLIYKNNTLSLSKPQLLFRPKTPLSLLSHPTYDPSGESIVFSMKKDGFLKQSLYIWDRHTKTVSLLFENGARNYDVFFHPKTRALYFVSDQTGIENIYHLVSKNKAQRLTHVFAPVRFPTFVPNEPDTVYASIMRETGWNLAKLSLSQKPFSLEKIPFQKSFPDQKPNTPLPPLTKQDTSSQYSASVSTYKIKNYHALSTLSPRSWQPIVNIQSTRPNRFFLGAQLLGFDATLEHQYRVQAGYDSFFQIPEGSIDYSLRILGLESTFSGSFQIEEALLSGSTLLSSEKKLKLSWIISYPGQETYSTWRPRVFVQAQKSFYFDRTQPLSSWTRPFYFELGTGFTFSNTRSSPLAIVSEQGFFFDLETSTFFLSSQQTFRFFLQFEHFLKLWSHSVLESALEGGMSSHLGDDLNTDLFIQSPIVFFPLSKEILITGYPNFSLHLRKAAKVSFTLWQPLWRWYRGIGLIPFYLKHLSFFFKPETVLIPSDFSLNRNVFKSYSSLETGMRLSGLILHYVPFELFLTYTQGIQRGGEKSLGVSFQIGSLF